MRVMVIVKAAAASEAGCMPDRERIQAMGRFNDELAAAGVLLSAEGLKPSSSGVRVALSGDRRSVIDGPFAETHALIAGFWLWQVPSMQAAIDWVRRCPAPHDGGSEIEIRPLFEAEDFIGA